LNGAQQQKLQRFKIILNFLGNVEKRNADEGLRCLGENPFFTFLK